MITLNSRRRRGMSVRFRALMGWPPDWQFVWQLSAGAVLFLVTVVGLLLPHHAP
jgi:hypothetical protein